METSTKDPGILLRKPSCKWLNAGVVAGLNSLGSPSCHSHAHSYASVLGGGAAGSTSTGPAAHRHSRAQDWPWPSPWLCATQNSPPFPKRQQHSAKHHPAPTSSSAPNYSFPPGSHFPLLTTVEHFSPLGSSVPNTPSSSQAVTHSWRLQDIQVLPFPERTLPTSSQLFTGKRAQGSAELGPCTPELRASVQVSESLSRDT